MTLELLHHLRKNPLIILKIFINCTRLAELQDVLSATFFNIDWGERGRGGIVILVMISDKNMQFFDCSKVFWPELSELQEKH